MRAHRKRRLVPRSVRRTWYRQKLRLAGVADGATLAAGGSEVSRKHPDITLLRPCLRMCHHRKPWRGTKSLGQSPLSCVCRTMTRALSLANDSEFGLSAGIVTRDTAKIDHFSQNAEAGMIQVNLPTAGMDFHAPFTGRKGSSYGAPEKGSYAREFFTAAKVVHEGRGQ